jgi:hypothetical protein
LFSFVDLQITTTTTTIQQKQTINEIAVIISQFISSDVNKTSKIFDFFEECGWINRNRNRYVHSISLHSFFQSFSLIKLSSIHFTHTLSRVRPQMLPALPLSPPAIPQSIHSPMPAAPPISTMNNITFPPNPNG